MKDRISQQPDEILVYILSFLTLKEAGRSSLLSRRWKDLWKLTTSLDFEYEEPIDDEEPKGTRLGLPRDEMEKHLFRKRSKFVTWVTHALRLHESPSLDLFRVQFYLDASSSKNINEWIKLIRRKRVKILKLNFATDYYTHRTDKCYTLSFKSASNLSSIKCLTRLSLCYVNVDGKILEYLLSNCPHLERVSVSNSEHKSKLKVGGKSLQLKYLKVYSCQWQSIELSAPKLVSFRCFEGLNFHIGSNPLLSDLTVGGRYNTEVTGSVLVSFSSHLPQLQTLSMSMWFQNSQQVIPELPLLRNLKHLVLGIQISSSDPSLIKFTKLIAAAPSLVKFTLKLGLYIDEPSNRRVTKVPSIEPHQCLKEVKIEGFVGGYCDYELAKFLLKNAINLEKMVILIGECRRRDSGKDWARRIRRRINLLKRMLAPGAELID